MKEPSLAGLAIVLPPLYAVFWLIESRWAALRGQPRWRADSRTDLAWWFFTPLVTGAFTRVVLGVLLALLVLAAGTRPGKESILAFLQRPTWISRQPLALQVLGVLLVGDLIGYWVHRAFHGWRRLWPFHAIHHGSQQLDWLSSVRVHPVNDVLGRAAQLVPLVLLGFHPGVLAAWLPLLHFYALLLHANVNWDFGPLRTVLASPAFHRWHHTSQEEGLDKNFAGLFPFYDWLFGTFYLPRGQQPVQFGLSGEQVPRGLWAQLMSPFRRSGLLDRPR